MPAFTLPSSFDPFVDPKAAAPGSSKQESQQTSSSQGQTYSSNPDLMQRLAGSLGGVIGQQSQDYSNFVNNPTSNPAYTNALSGMLAGLVPSENDARRNLADTFRAAGNTASSTFGQKAMGLESDILRNRQTTASDLLAKLYPSIAQAKFAPLSQTNGLIDALKLQEQSSQSQGTSSGTSQSYNPNGSTNFSKPFSGTPSGMTTTGYLGPGWGF